MTFIISDANLYATMSYKFYNEYLVDEGQSREEKGIAAVVFQALAIEAYTNLWGALVFGKAEFEEKYGKHCSTASKLNIIAKECSAEYPPEHLSQIRDLFTKRDSLVHSKAKEYTVTLQSAFDYEHPENNYSDYLRLVSDVSYVFDGIDEQMNLYGETQENIRIIRGAEDELINEMLKKQFLDTISETDRIVRETIISLTK